ncbi:glycosyltransferase family 2 protein [Mycobacterium intracellulare]|uniref:glycosyltransferase family 2 protein n=1 Tax=Mycobacterium intracellulare TaxID=1767 RepID=UPI001EEE2AD2|nr:glycosyltransferase family 2 protein [Mycobacterium intracellulare]MEE3749837.1 glycosyltransferase family 2 protein [Mycobacterium intracellulare]
MSEPAGQPHTDAPPVDRIDDAPAKPLISVCVPMYNNAATIERCLRSVLDQDGVEFEIVIVDDQSTDDGATKAASLLRPGDQLIRNHSRLGLNGNHNRCLELARGDHIQFLHGDDWLLPGALRTLARSFDDPDVGLVFAPRRVQTDDLPWSERRRAPSKLHVYFVKLREHNRGSSLVLQIVGLWGASANLIGEPSCVMFRRQLALQAGGLRDDIYQTVDLDFWLRLMLRSAVCFVPRELSVRHHTGSTESANITKAQRHWLDQLRIVTWMIVDPASTNAVRAAATPWWLLVWLGLLFKVTVFGPQRCPRLKTLLAAPFSEFVRARRFRDVMIRN